MRTKENNFYEVKSLIPSIQSVKGIDMSKRTVEYAFSSYNVLDSGGDVCLPGCMKKTIQENGPSSSAVCKIKHLLFHNTTRTPGTIIDLAEGEFTDNKGRTILGGIGKTEMNPTTDGNDTLINYQMKTYDNHSFGYEVLDSEYIAKEGHGNSKKWDKLISQLINPEDSDGISEIRVLKQIRLYEVSTVSFGMNSLTPTLGVKGTKEENMDLQTLFFYEKIEDLKKMIKKGGEEAEIFLINLQTLQIKQMVKELLEQSNEIKELPEPPKQKESESESENKFSFPTDFSLNKESNNSSLSLPKKFSL